MYNLILLTLPAVLTVNTKRIYNHIDVIMYYRVFYNFGSCVWIKLQSFEYIGFKFA